MSRKRRGAGVRWVAVLMAAALVLGPEPKAHAIFGEEDWLSGQNELLGEMLGNQLDELFHLTEIIANVKLVVGTVNDGVALARTAARVYQILKTYTPAKLLEEARRGFYKAVPEAGELDKEIREAVENGRAIATGKDSYDTPFWDRASMADARVSQETRAAFELGYQSMIWPSVFTTALETQKPTKVQQKIQDAYRRTGENARQAAQQAASVMLAKKVAALVDDADNKDNAQLLGSAVQAQAGFQTMRNTTELLNFEEQRVAEQQVQIERSDAVVTEMLKGLKRASGLLIAPGGRVPPKP